MSEMGHHTKTSYVNVFIYRLLIFSKHLKKFVEIFYIEHFTYLSINITV